MKFDQEKDRLKSKYRKYQDICMRLRSITFQNTSGHSSH